MRPRRAVLLTVLAPIACGACSCGGVGARAIEAGFWFEPVAYDSRLLAGPITADEIEEIATIARAELAEAFAGLAIRFTDRRNASYGVRVVQEVRDLRFRRPVEVAGESRAVPGFGGRGAVSFYYAASNADAFAPPGADRAEIVAAIGRGVGRAAVHEFTHQLLPKAAIHDSANARSYEYRSAARLEQYYGRLEWDLAWPLLQKRIGLAPPHGSR